MNTLNTFGNGLNVPEPPAEPNANGEIVNGDGTVDVTPVTHTHVLPKSGIGHSHSAPVPIETTQNTVQIR